MISGGFHRSCTRCSTRHPETLHWPRVCNRCSNPGRRRCAPTGASTMAPGASRVTPTGRILVSLSLFATSATLAPAPAPDAGAACGRTDPDAPWRTADTCHLWFRGFPLIVQGDALGANNETQLRVWLSPLEDPTVALVECTGTDAGSGFARCSSGLPDETTEWPWPTAARAVLLYCNVEGADRGTYQCVSGFGG